MTENPYNPQKPTLDPTQFYGREDALAFLKLHLSARRTAKALVVLGQRGMGKSALLQHVPLVVDERYPSVKIDAAALELDSVVALVATIVDQSRAMMNAIQASTYRLPDFPNITDPNVNLLAWLADEYLSVVFSAIRRSRHLILMMDNVDAILAAMDAGSLPANFMDYWQALLDRYEQLHLLFSLDISNEERALQTPPMDDASLYYRLSNLSEADAKQVLTEPIRTYYGFTEEALDYALALAGGHPYHLHSIGWLLYRRWEGERNRINIITLQDVIAIYPAALELAEDTIGPMWPFLRSNERLVLTSLLDINESANAEELRDWLLDTDFPLNVVQIGAAVRGLEYYGIVSTSDDGRYRVASKLQAEWLRRMNQIESSTSPENILPARRTWLPLLFLAAIVLVIAVVLGAGALSGGSDDDSDNAIGSTITLDNQIQITPTGQETASSVSASPSPETPPVFRFGG